MIEPFPTPRTKDESGLMDPRIHQGRYGEHLIQLVATSAGFICNDTPDLGDGIDLVVSRADADGEILIPPKVELQVKTVRQPSYVEGKTKISYPLEVRHYDMLRKKSGTSRYLVVVVVPEHPDPGYWIGATDSFFVFHQAAYWRDLRDLPAVPNSSKVAVHVPLDQRYTRNTVHQHMKEARERLTLLLGGPEVSVP